MSRPQRLLPQKRPAASLPLLLGGGGGAAGAPAGGAGGGTIDRYYLSRHCAVCDELTHATRPLCPACLATPQLAAGVLAARVGRLERQLTQLLRVCAHCGGGGGPDPDHGERKGAGGGLLLLLLLFSSASRLPTGPWLPLLPLPTLPRPPGGVVCVSLDCGVYFERRKLHHERRVAARLAEAGLEALEPSSAPH